MVERLDVDEWGKVESDTNSGWQPFGFDGGLEDAATGLVRFGARDLDPRSGRWTAKDGAGFGGGSADLFGFAWNDPVNFLDLSGFHPRSEIDWGWNYPTQQELSQAFPGGIPDDPFLFDVGHFKEWHYSRNQYNTVVSCSEAKKTWHQLGFGASAYHMHGPGGLQNQKFISPDGHSEVVFDGSGNLVTDPANEGTYNFGTDFPSHFAEDMLPYYIWGNTPDDPTPAADRVFPGDVVAAKIVQSL